MLFLLGCPLSDLSIECNKLRRDGYLGDESTLPDACRGLSLRWDDFLIQMRRKWQSGEKPSEEDRGSASRMLEEVRQIVGRVDAAGGAWPEELGRGYDLGKTVGRGKFLGEEAFEDWRQETVLAVEELDPEGEWSEDCINTIDSHREDETRSGVRDLVSRLRQEILGSIEPTSPPGGTWARVILKEVARQRPPTCFVYRERRDEYENRSSELYQCLKTTTTLGISVRCS